MKNPEERIKESSGSLLDDRIIGILIGFHRTCVERDLWIDIITIREAREEIKQLLEDYKAGKLQ